MTKAPAPKRAYKKRTKLRPELSGKPDKKKVVKRAKKKQEFIPVDRAGRRLDDPDRFKKPGMIQPSPKKSWWQTLKELFNG